MILFVYCAGGLGKEVMDLAETINRRQERWEEIYFVDDIFDGKEFYAHKVVRFEEMLAISKTLDIEVAIANGEPNNRKKLYGKCQKARVSIATLIHPDAMISSTAQIGEGVIVKGASSISSDVVIGNNVYLQPHCTVGHDSVIGEHSLISCFVSVPGKCRIDECVYIATGAILNDGIKIEKYAIIGLGSVVFRNVKEAKIVMGNPAKVIGDNEDKTVFHRFE